MLGFILMLVAMILFILAAWPKVSDRLQFIGIGLAFMAASFAFGLYPG